MSGTIMKNSSVSQSGVVNSIPYTEQMTASYDNASANYVKFSNGLLICQADYMMSQSSADITWTYPHAFLTGSRPAVAGTATEDEDRFTCPTGNQSNTQWVFRAWITSSFSGGTSLSKTTTKQNIMAIGRRK